MARPIKMTVTYFRPIKLGLAFGTYRWFLDIFSYASPKPVYFHKPRSDVHKMAASMRSAARLAKTHGIFRKSLIKLNKLNTLSPLCALRVEDLFTKGKFTVSPMYGGK